MPNFDFIAAKEFRESLEADYAEMRRCEEVAAWKSVHVLSGSIVESLLIDYLSSTPNSARPKKDPLKLELFEAISICRDEKVLSDRTADLCSVIRSYRNLIHPARMVRLDEQSPDKGSAAISLALVDMISDDLARVIRASVGLTGEQILSKIRRDSNSVTILKHLIDEVPEHHRSRLLLELIPPAYLEASSDPFDDTDDRLKVAYRIVLDTVSTDVRKRVASEFVRILKEGDGDWVLSYGAAFFRCSDIGYLPPAQQAMVCQHLLAKAKPLHTPNSLSAVQGIEPYLKLGDLNNWLDPYIRTLVSSASKESVKAQARQQLVASSLGTPSELNPRVLKRFDAWIKHYKDAGAEDSVEILRKVRTEVEGLQGLF